MGEKKFKTTKADERAALELIKDILAELDPAGYVNTAFEGCCDVAENNIDNDFANSYKSSVEYLTKELREMRIAQGDLETKFNNVDKFYKHRGELLDACFEQVDYFKGRYEQLKIENEYLRSENKKLQIENEQLQAQLHTANGITDAYKIIVDERIENLKQVNAHLSDLINKVKRF